jgi:hypothetical protein
MSDFETKTLQLLEDDPEEKKLQMEERRIEIKYKEALIKNMENTSNALMILAQKIQLN